MTEQRNIDELIDAALDVYREWHAANTRLPHEINVAIIEMALVVAKIDPDKVEALYEELCKIRNRSRRTVDGY